MQSNEGLPAHEFDPTIIEHTKTETGEYQLRRIRSGSETHFELILDGVFLMATYNGASSSQLTDAAIGGLKGRRHVELLIGGLGMGFSLQRALQYECLHRVCVVELEPKIIDWNRDLLGNASLLDDPRTELVVGDFCEFLESSPSSYHGVALDIDNGPDWVVRSSNRRAYSLTTLQLLKARLRPEGVLAIWSHDVSPSYEQALQEVFDDVRTETAQDHDLNGKPLDSVIYAVCS